MKDKEFYLIPGQILIVEDDSFLNKMLAYNLTADGYGVTSALNARTAEIGRAHV